MPRTPAKPRHMIPINMENAASKDWIILLEANTIVGVSSERFRVARATQERRIVKRLQGFRVQLFLVIPEYDPRIHVLFFCPQLYKHDHDARLVPMRGDEIGDYIARALQEKAAIRRPWYKPTDALPERPLVTETMLDEFDTLVIEPPPRPALTGPAQHAKAA
jgi:hypothetical protein